MRLDEARGVVAEAYTTMPCPRCNGQGFIQHYRNIAGGVCFKCGGSGKVRYRKARAASKPEPTGPNPYFKQVPFGEYLTIWLDGHPAGRRWAWSVRTYEGQPYDARSQGSEDNMLRALKAARAEARRISAQEGLPLPESVTEAGYDYRGSHGAPGPEAAPLHDLTRDLGDGPVYPDDVYTHMRYYYTGDPLDAVAERIIKRYRGKPGAKVTIYRAAPKGIDRINPGDWVTIVRQYAVQHSYDAEGPGQDWPVIAADVKAKDVTTNGDSLLEWGYNGPSAVRGKVVESRLDEKRPSGQALAVARRRARDASRKRAKDARGGYMDPIAYAAAMEGKVKVGGRYYKAGKEAIEAVERLIATAESPQRKDRLRKLRASLFKVTATSLRARVRGKRPRPAKGEPEPATDEAVREAVGLRARIEALRPKLAQVGQAVVDEWEQDEEGFSDQYGGGGVCDDIAREMGDVLAQAGIDSVDGGQDGDDHAWLIAYDSGEGAAYGVDIPPDVYETGGGMSWRKIEGARVSPRDVTIFAIPYEDIADVVDELEEGIAHVGRKRKRISRRLMALVRLAYQRAAKRARVYEGRDYKREYRLYSASRSEKDKRVGRNTARRRLIKAGRVRKGDGRDVHHKDGDPTNNRPSNIAVRQRGGHTAQHNVEGVNETIVRRGSKWLLLSKRTGKVLGKHDTKEDALAQERAIKASQARRG